MKKKIGLGFHTQNCWILGMALGFHTQFFGFGGMSFVCGYEIHIPKTQTHIFWVRNVWY